MNGFDLSGLTPEELQQLTIHAVQSSQECADALNQMTSVIQMLIDKLGEHDEHINRIDKVVTEEIVGGINQLYDKNMHDMQYDGIKQQYGPLFEPHMGALSEMYPDADLFEELLQEKGNYPDEEAFGGRVNEIAGMLKSKMDRIRGVPAEIQAAPEDVANSASAPAGQTSEMPPESGNDGGEAIIAMVKKMKARKNPLALS